MKKHTIASHVLRLEQLEPRCLLNGMPVVLSQQRFGNSEFLTYSLSVSGFTSPSNSADQPSSFKPLSSSDQQLDILIIEVEPAPVQLSPASGSPSSGEATFALTGPAVPSGFGAVNMGVSIPYTAREETADQNEMIDNAGTKEVLEAPAPAQSAPEAEPVLARTPISGNSVAVGGSDAGLPVSGKATTLGRVGLEASSAAVDTVFSQVSKAIGNRFDSSSPGLNPEIAAPLERGALPPAEPASSGSPTPETLALSVGPAGSADHAVARLSGVLGRLSYTDAGIVERGIRQFLKGVQEAKHAAFGQDNDNSLLPWITAVAVAALACEIGRRQMRRSACRANCEDARNGLRDLLFLNLDRRP
jgi:hypothetical protein